jgi:hypothetical protein
MKSGTAPPEGLGASTADQVRALREETDIQIDLSDGCRLAASAYFPEDAEGPLPVIFSYYPYRKDDFIGVVLDDMRRYFAERGYVDVLVDFRGTGSSEGYCWDTWDAVAEGRDGADVVEWISRQSWCDGNVGMWGISYGGISTFNVAVQRPPHLKACLPIYGTADIYHDFIYPGGIPNAIGNGVRETSMLAMDLAPPTRVAGGATWRERWAERLKRFEDDDLWSLRWPSHPDFDAHWQQRVPDVSKIQVPVFGIGGWNDIFPNGMVNAHRMMSGPRKLVMGPWVHVPPHVSERTPWEWRSEAVRWWDRWLKGEESCTEAEPDVRVFFQGVEEWRGADEWPQDRAESMVLDLAPRCRLVEQTAEELEEDVYEADMTVGLTGPLFDPMGTGLGYPLDQGRDAHRSLSYTGEPLTEDLWICGSPSARLLVRPEDGSDFDLVAKLSDVAPDGSSAHIATGWRGARHAEGTASAIEIRPGVPLRVDVDMWATAYRVPAGHSLRLSVSCSDFPHSYPTPSRPTIRVLVGAGGSTLAVPLAGHLADAEAPEMELPGGQINDQRIRRMTPVWRIEENVAEDSASVTYGNSSELLLDRGTDYRSGFEGTATVSNRDPVGGRLDAQAYIEVRLDSGELVRVDAASQITRDSLLMNGRVEIDGRCVLDRQWSSYQSVSAARRLGPTSLKESPSEEEIPPN